jgi:hypothetical protein
MLRFSGERILSTLAAPLNEHRTQPSPLQALVGLPTLRTVLACSILPLYDERRTTIAIAGRRAC